jgi:hypothetical protein
MAIRKGDDKDPMADLIRRRILPPDEEQRGYIRAARHEAPRNAERLRSLSFREQMSLVEQDEALQGWALAELLCDESLQSVAAGRPQEALERAKVALRIAGLAREEPSWRMRLEGYVWSHLANAQRALGELREAEETFRHAESLWLSGAVSHPGPLESARALRLEALLRKAQGRLKEGLDLLDRAQSIAHTGEDRIVRIQKGAFLAFSERWEEALRELLRAGKSLEPRHPPRLHLDFLFDLLVCLLHSGRPEQAQAMIAESAKLVAAHGTEVDRTRLRWQEARAAAGLQQTAEAIPAFADARRGLTEQNLLYDAALAGLELIAFQADLGRTAEAKDLGRELAPLATSERIPRESQATIKLFCRLLEKDSLDPEKIRRFAADFRRTAGDPNLRFELWTVREEDY